MFVIFFFFIYLFIYFFYLRKCQKNFFFWSKIVWKGYKFELKCELLENHIKTLYHFLEILAKKVKKCIFFCKISCLFLAFCALFDQNILTSNETPLFHVRVPLKS